MGHPQSEVKITTTYPALARLPFLVHIVEVPEHLNSANMGARIVYHTLATILDEVLQQLEGLHIV